MFSNHFLNELACRHDWAKRELVALLQAEFPDAAEATLTWRIHDLKSRGLLHAAGRGQYTTQPAKPDYLPIITSGPLRLYQKATAVLPSGTARCLTDTAWLSELLGLSSPVSFILIETEKAQLNTVYDALVELSRKVFLNPDASDVQRYVSTHDRAVVLRPLVSEAPTNDMEGVIASSLEKLLVDAIVYTDLYANLQPHLPTLFYNVRSQFSLNESRIRRYARRRDRLNEIEPYLTNITAASKPKLIKND